ncbi:glycosyltransferase family 4 protein [Vibrio sinaloensis]|nr:glycosyltransferase family 4 protein [Vibrio sinaloensis]
MINVLFFGPDINDESLCGGQVTHVKNIVNLFGEHEKVSVSSLASSGGNHDNEYFYKKVFRLIRVAVWLFVNCKEYDVFHINSTFDNRSLVRDGIFISILILKGKKYFVQFHGGEPERASILKFRLFNSLMKKLLSESSKLLVLTDNQMNSVKRYIGCESELVSNFLDYEPEVEDKNINTVPTFLFLARVDKKKGIYELLDAVHSLSDINIKLLIAGSGPDLNDVRSRVLKLGLDERVEFTGFVQGDDKTAVYRSADFFILPSYEEAFPYSVLEAQSFGLPVVATKVGSLEKIISDGSNGFLIEPQDSHSISKVMRALVSESHLYPELSRSSFTNSLRYSRGAMEKTFISLWKLS